MNFELTTSNIEDTELSSSSSDVECERITLPSLCTTSFSEDRFSYKWVINDAERRIVNASTSLRSSCFDSLLGDNLSVEVQWIRDEPDKVQPGKLSVTLTVQPTKKLFLSNFYFLITDCFSKRRIKFKDSLLELKRPAVLHSRNSLNYSSEYFSIQESISIAESEPITQLFHNGVLTIQVTATIMDMSPTQSITNSCAIPDHEFKAKINGMYQEGLFTDLSIVAGDKTFKVHKLVLASQSDVFKRMLESDMKEKKESVVKLSDVAPEVVEDLLAYFYTGSCPNMKELAKELLIEADKYNIPRLRLMCENELKMNLKIDTVTSVLLLAEKIEQGPDSTLLESCIQFIKQHFTSVRECEDWKENVHELTRDLLSKLYG